MATDEIMAEIIRIKPIFEHKPDVLQQIEKVTNAQQVLVEETTRLLDLVSEIRMKCPHEIFQKFFAKDKKRCEFISCNREHKEFIMKQCIDCGIIQNPNGNTCLECGEGEMKDDSSLSYSEGPDRFHVRACTNKCGHEIHNT